MVMMTHDGVALSKCAWCGAAYASTNPHARTCSSWCWAMHKDAERRASEEGDRA
jgi:hypothetical protein